MARCRSCDGTGETFGFVTRADGCRPEALTCSRCRGTGEVPEEMEHWIVMGAALRADRQRRGLGLRDMARELGCSVVDLSRAEQGKIDPVTVQPNWSGPLPGEEDEDG